MMGYYETEELRQKLIDRFTPEELVEALGVDVDKVFDHFFDECIEKDWSEYFE